MDDRRMKLVVSAFVVLLAGLAVTSAFGFGRFGGGFARGGGGFQGGRFGGGYGGEMGQGNIRQSGAGFQQRPAGGDRAQQLPAGNVGAGRFGADNVGAGRFGAGDVGAGRFGADNVGAGRFGPENTVGHRDPDRWNDYSNRWHGHWHAGATTGVHFHAGATVARLPNGSVAYHYHGSAYHYGGGVFYRRSGSGYVTCLPPYGIVVPILPPACQTVYVDNSSYYYANGSYYQQTDQPADTSDSDGSSTDDSGYAGSGSASGSGQNYQVVKPPLGATVNQLPEGATETTVDGNKVYVYEGTYYRPFYSGSTVVYQVVAPPN